MIKPAIPSGDGNGGARAAAMESVAGILERQIESTIHDWMAMVEKEPELTRISLNYEERAGHLPRLLHDVIARLNTDAKAPVSVAAGHHGDLRYKQGYTVANVVTESRLLEACIFTTLHKNTNHIDFSKLLLNIVTIADEVDTQLKQQVLRFMTADIADGKSNAKAN